MAARTQKGFIRRNIADDQVISQRVRDAITNDKSFSGQAKGINIDSDWGVVTLSGNVKNDSEKNKIEALAKSVNGVKKVNNQLKVK